MGFGINDVYQYSPLIKMSFFLCLVWQFSYYGVPAFFALWFLYETLNKKLFRLLPVKGGDRMFLFWEDRNRFNIIAAFYFEHRLNLDNFKTKFNERLRILERLRCVLVKTQLDVWWKILSYEEALKRIVFREVQVNLKTFEDTQVEVERELLIYEDYENRLPYEFIILKNSNSELGDVMLFKFDHLFTDGLGYISLLFGIADNYNTNDFPHMGKFSIYETVKAYVLSPLYIVISFYRNIFEIRGDKSPFKNDGRMIGRTKYSISPRHDFRLVSRVSKKLGVTFNDLMLAVVSRALTMYLNDNKLKHPYPDLKYFLMQNTIGTRGIPTSYHELKLENDSISLPLKVPLINNILDVNEIKGISFNTKKYLKDFSLAYSLRLFCTFLLTYLPAPVFRLIVNKANHDMVYTNLPGPKKPLFYAGNKLEEFLIYTTTGFHPVLIGIVSYDEKYRIAYGFDKSLSIESSEINWRVEEVLDTLISKTS